MPKQIVKQYLHGDKEAGYELAEQLGFQEGTEAFDNVRGWAYEVEFDLEVDMETGRTRIIMVDGEAVDVPRTDEELKSV